MRSDFKINNNSIGNNYHPNPFGGIYASGLNSNGLGSSFIADIGIDSSNSIEDIAMGIFRVLPCGEYPKQQPAKNWKRNQCDKNASPARFILKTTNWIISGQGIIAANNYQSEIYIESNRLNENFTICFNRRKSEGNLYKQ